MGRGIEGAVKNHGLSKAGLSFLWCVICGGIDIQVQNYGGDVVRVALTTLRSFERRAACL